MEPKPQWPLPAAPVPLGTAISASSSIACPGERGVAEGAVGLWLQAARVAATRVTSTR